MPTMKFVCSGCGIAWSGDATKKGTNHTTCKGNPKGVWEPATETVVTKSNGGTSHRSKNFVQPDSDYTLWDKGQWRGWAVSSVDKYNDVFIDLTAHDGRTLDVLEDRLRKDVQSGKAFILQPNQVVELLARQLSRFEPSEKRDQLLQHLIEAGVLYQDLKRAFETEGTHEVMNEIDLIQREVEDA